jgi:uncharacterized protein YneF (UPF0154 family)
MFLSFFILPFLPLFESEKGAPLLFILGVLGLYYLLRKTARQILWPQTGAKPAHQKIRPVVRWILYGMVLLVGLSAGYFIYDLSSAKQMAANACRFTTAGMPVGEFLLKFPESDYKIIRGSESITIVPKRGMGRNSCIVAHDGRIITGAKSGFAD